MLASLIHVCKVFKFDFIRIVFFDVRALKAWQFIVLNIQKGQDLAAVQNMGLDEKICRAFANRCKISHK